MKLDDAATMARNRRNRASKSRDRSFRAANSSLILLSKRDQEFLLESLMAPAEPNDALRRAFMKKVVPPIIVAPDGYTAMLLATSGGWHGDRRPQSW